MDQMGIKRGPKEVSQTQQSCPLFTKSKPSRLDEYSHRDSSSSDPPDTPPTPPKASNTQSNDCYRTTVAKLDTLIRDMKWPFTQPQIQDRLNTLERIKTHFLVALSSDSVRLSRLIRDQLQIIHGEVHMIKDNTTAFRKHQEGSKEWSMEQKLIFQSISNHHFSSEVAPDKVGWLTQSASEFFNHKLFSQWLTGGNSLLLSGAAGTGKPSMCRVVENYLRSLAPSSQSFVVAIYFSFNNQHRLQSLQAVLSFVVETMLRVEPQLKKHYDRLMLAGEGPLEVTDCLRIIHRTRQDFQHFYLVIDALDEWDAQQAREIVERLTQLRSPLKIFATSRPEALAGHFFHQIIMTEVVSAGMKSYIRETLAERVPFVVLSPMRNDPARFDEVVDAIFVKNNGVYVSSFGR